MKKATRLVPFAVLAFALAALPCSAQSRTDTVEISPFAAYLFGGELTYDWSDPNGGKIDADDEAGWGIRFGYNINDVFGVEMSYLHEDTRMISGEGLFQPDQEIGDLDIDIIEGNMLFNMGHHRFRPFFLMGLGATRLDPDGASLRSDTRFSGSMGGGFKLFFTPQVGLRTDVKYRWTLIDDSEDDYDYDYDCDHDCGNDTFGQAEVSVGLVFAF